MPVLSEAQGWTKYSYDSRDEGAEQGRVCICLILFPPIPLSLTQVAVLTPLADKDKWKRPHEATLLRSVHQEGLVRERHTLGNSEFLGKSVTTTQQQISSITHIQLWDLKVNEGFSVRLETQDGVHCGDVEIKSGP